MDIDSKSAPNFHILSSGVAKSIINLCMGQIRSLKLIPRSRIAGSEGLQKCKALGFYCQIVQEPLVFLRGEEPAPGVMGTELGAARTTALPVTSPLKVGGIITISQTRNPRADCVTYPKSQHGK